MKFPDSVWLQENYGRTDIDPCWCEEKVWDTAVEYVRKDIMDERIEIICGNAEVKG
jgi:hypothetical protein